MIDRRAFLGILGGLESAGAGGSVLALAAALLDQPGAEPEHVAAALLALRGDRDATSERATLDPRPGAAPGAAGRSAIAAEPGASLLCLGTALPLGLLHAGGYRGIADTSAAACRVLADDPRCVAACRAVAFAAALLASGRAAEVADRASLVASPSPAVREAVETGVAPRDAPPVVRAVAAAFAALSSGSIPEGLGPDVAAVAGAFLGAAAGIEPVQMGGRASRWLEIAAAR